MRPPTREEYRNFCNDAIDRAENVREMLLPINEMSKVLDEIRKKYLSDPNSVESPETKSEDKSLSLIESMKKMEDGFKIVYFAKGSSYMIERLPIPDGGIYRPPVGDYILISE